MVKGDICRCLEGEISSDLLISMLLGLLLICALYLGIIFCCLLFSLEFYSILGSALALVASTGWSSEWNLLRFFFCLCSRTDCCITFRPLPMSLACLIMFPSTRLLTSKYRFSSICLWWERPRGRWGDEEVMVIMVEQPIFSSWLTSNWF